MVSKARVRCSTHWGYIEGSGSSSGSQFMARQTATPLVNRFDYHRLGEAGALAGDRRVELVDGEIIEMSPIGSRHAGCVDTLNRLFSRRLSARVLVRIQSPIVLDDFSEPQPDVVLLRPRADNYRRSHPGAADVVLLVEVLDSSVDRDRARKVPAYANARITEVWLVNLEAETIEVLRQPSRGEYHSTVSYRRGARLAAGVAPATWFRVNDILGEP